jgi:hypothetical protein
MGIAHHQGHGFVAQKLSIIYGAKSTHVPQYNLTETRKSQIKPYMRIEEWPAAE